MSSDCKLAFSPDCGNFFSIGLIWADSGYSDKLIDWKNSACGWILEIVKSSYDVKDFQALPHKWR